MYGMGAESLAGRLTKFSGEEVTTQAAQEYITKLYDQFPGIKRFMLSTKADGAKHVRSKDAEQDS